MRWINFVDGSKYTFASDIQKFAESNGYKVPCEADGQRHPGTDCNSKMRMIFKDAGMRRSFGVTDQSVVDVRMEDSPGNSCFLYWLVDTGQVHSAYLRKGGIQLYAKEAVNALLSVMLGNAVSYEEDQRDEQFKFSMLVTKRSHSLEKGKYKPKASLFNK